MSKMVDAIGMAALLTTIVLLVVTLYHLIRRTGQAKRFAFFTLSAFVVMVLAVAIAGPNSPDSSTASNPASQQATSLPQQEEEKAPETSANSQEQQIAPFQATLSAESTIQTEPQPSAPETTVKGTLKVHFLDVGQADSILVQLPSGQNLLIDGGNNDDGSLVVNYLKQQGVKRLDHVIGTHPHEDHIGGLDVAIHNFDVGKVYLPRVSHTTKTYEDLLLAIKEKGLKATEAKAGGNLDVGNGVKAIFLAPNGSGYEDLNDYSAVLKLTYGNTTFIFTGDAEAVSEGEMLAAGADLKADVLKVGHHGSNSSTTPAFLKTVSPKYAVISVGKGNDYGHPHPETLAKLAEAGVQVFRTDLQGTIVATSDGKTIILDKKATPIKERAPDSTTEAPVVPVAPTGPTAPSGGVKITGLDLRAEVVTIKNTSSSTVDLSGWRLVSEKGNQEFIFPTGTTLPPGGTLKVVSGPEAQGGPGVLVWTRKNIWNNDGDPGALYDAQGNLVSRR